MRLKATIASALSALALCGVMASGAAASVVINPTPQEFAEHPGQGYAVSCDMSEQESRDSQFTDEYVNKANAEGKCKAFWFNDTTDYSKVNKGNVRASKAKQARGKHGKAHRHTRHR